MSTDAWQTLGTIVALLLIGAYNAYQGRRAEKQAKQAHSAATTAVRQTEHTGNGFAGDVLGRLQRIEERGEHTHDLAERTHTLMTDHLSAHANSDLDKS